MAAREFFGKEFSMENAFREIKLEVVSPVLYKHLKV